MITRRRFIGFSQLIGAFAIIPAWLSNLFLRRRPLIDEPVDHTVAAPIATPVDAPVMMFKIVGKNCLFYQTEPLRSDDFRHSMRRLETLNPPIACFEVWFGKDKGKWFLVNFDTKRYVVNPSRGEIVRSGLNNELGIEAMASTLAVIEKTKDNRPFVLMFDPKLFEIPAGFREVDSL